jgi:hypothetical protein
MPSDLLTFALPFFFVLAVVYGALEISDIFKRGAVKALISLIIAFFAITNEFVVLLILSLLPYAALFFIAFFFIGFLYSFIRKEEKSDPTLLAVVFGLVLIFLAVQGQDIIKEIMPQGFITPENFSVMAGLLVIIVIFLAVYKAFAQGK